MDLRFNSGIDHLQTGRVFEKKAEKKEEEKSAEEMTKEPRTAAPEAKPITAEATAVEDAYGRAILNQTTYKPVKEPVEEVPNENQKGNLNDYNTWVSKWRSHLSESYDEQLSALDQYIDAATDNDEKAFWHIIRISVVQNHYLAILENCESFENIPQELLDSIMPGYNPQESVPASIFDSNYDATYGATINKTEDDYTFVANLYGNYYQEIMLNGGHLSQNSMNQLGEVGYRNLLNLLSADMNMWRILDTIMIKWYNSLTPPTSDQEQHYITCHNYFNSMYDSDNSKEKIALGQLGEGIFQTPS